jgi:repressor LexA
MEDGGLGSFRTILYGGAGMENTAPARRGRPPGSRTAEGQLTSRQAAIVRYITETVDRQGYPPSMREIGQAVHLVSTSSVAHQLMALERKGILYRDPHTPRAYRVRPSWAPDLGGRSEAPVDVPLVGRIAAGAPLLAEEMVEDVYSLPRQVVGDGDLFALKLERRRVRSDAPCRSCGCSCRSGPRVDASLDRVEI